MLAGPAASARRTAQAGPVAEYLDVGIAKIASSSTNPDLDEVTRAREDGSLGRFPFIRMERDFQEMGVPLEACCQRGIATAPVWDDLPRKMWVAPDQVERFKG